MPPYQTGSAEAGNGPSHILGLSKKEQMEFIDSFDLVLSDCDGVVWLLVGNIAGAGAAVNRLRSAGKTVKFVSNNSFRTTAGYNEKFKELGADGFTEDDVVHPVKTIVRYLQLHKPGERVFSLMSDEANETLAKHGIEFETLRVKEHLNCAKLVEQLAIERPVGAVLCDIHLDLSYVELAKAVRYLQTSECCELIVGASDAIMPLTHEINVPGFLDFIEQIGRYGQRKPILLGKPSPELGKILKEIHGIRTPKRCLFIGDMLVQDVQFGKTSGFQTLLVLSGGLSKQDMLSASAAAQPDYYADSLADFITLLDKIDS